MFLREADRWPRLGSLALLGFGAALLIAMAVVAMAGLVKLDF